jgi:DNA polymerase III epsilon subunit-like protein
MTEQLPEIYNNLIFLDTETTGREEEDRIFQVAYEYRGIEREEMFLPPLPLCIEAMEATGYTNKDVVDKPPFAGSQMQADLQELLAGEAIFIAHNARFDITMLERDDVQVVRFIDTLKVARHLDPDALLGAYRLQYLRYALELEVEDAQAHDALGDVRVLKALFTRLFTKMRQECASDVETIEQMIQVSSQPTLIHKIPFGKYSGQMIVDIASTDPGYLQWLLKQKEDDVENSHDQNEDWIYTLRKALGRS